MQTETQQLTSKEKDFFSLIRQAIIANPFSRERMDINRQLSGAASGQSEADSLEKAVDTVKQRIQELDKSGRGDIQQFTEPDRKLVERLFAFDFFYTFRKEFDQLIEDQLEAGDRPVKLSFANTAKTFLLKRGFAEEAVRQIMEESYQFRRAFYFINHNLVGQSRVMQELRHDLWNNIFTHNVELYREYLRDRMEDFSTILLGETGSGKGAVAAAIGKSGYIPFDMKKNRFSESFTRSFTSINLSQFPQSIIESELFGHRKGAFTGAMDDYQGVFSRCGQHGAILLDEIGEISLPLQIKLLQVLQERFFYPVGSRKKERFSGRVIAATNGSLDQLRNDGVFRDDFYYRLCSDVIIVPPLRERLDQSPEELNNLITVIVRRIVGREAAELVQMVKEVISRQLGESYPWPGNVRELEQCVRRVLLKKDYAGDHRKSGNDLQSLLVNGLGRGNIPANRLVTGYCKLLYDRLGTFEEVSRRTRLDRRTVTKYVKEWDGGYRKEE